MENRPFEFKMYTAIKTKGHFKNNIGSNPSVLCTTYVSYDCVIPSDIDTTILDLPCKPTLPMIFVIGLNERPHNLHTIIIGSAFRSTLYIWANDEVADLSHDHLSYILIV